MAEVFWLRTAAGVLALAVLLGAFGAHALQGVLSEKSAEIWDTANLYHFIHGLGLLAVILVAKNGLLAPPWGTAVCVLLLIGVFVFSGSVYALAYTEIRWLGAITPFGGVAFISAWFLMAWKVSST